MLFISRKPLGGGLANLAALSKHAAVIAITALVMAAAPAVLVAPSLASDLDSRGRPFLARVSSASV